MVAAWLACVGAKPRIRSAGAKLCIEGVRRACKLMSLLCHGCIVCAAAIRLLLGGRPVRCGETLSMGLKLCCAWGVGLGGILVLLPRKPLSLVRRFFPLWPCGPTSVALRWLRIWLPLQVQFC